MPRPGPRPYECVRRAWHSDRHQPMRGSLIQEIFRLANEVHCASTKKNKEWQEKLPIVVLKAEEIMYSKANSEAEYMDLKNLQERVNNAIDTIIRRDETTETETGNLLQPCIEASLVLGCVPRRASRSQRHNSPRCYLSSNPQETAQASVPSTRITEKTTYSGPLLSQPKNASSNHVPQYMPYYSTIVTPSTGNATHLFTAPGPHRQNLPSLHSSDFRLMSNSFHQFCQDNAVDSSVIYPSLHCRIYPLYYISDQANNIQSVSELRSGSQENPLNFNAAPDAWKGVTQICSNVVSPSDESVDDEFDLSLRLGPPSNLDSQTENRWKSETLDIGSNRFCGAARLFDPSLSATSGQFGSSSVRNDKEFWFFPSGDHS